MSQRVRKLFGNVTGDEEARELLEQNPLEQDIVFRVEDGDDVLVSLEPGSAAVSVASGTAEYELFKTTVIELDQETLDALLDGDHFSEHYLNGDLHIRGLPSIKIVLGQLFRINREQQMAGGAD